MALGVGGAAMLAFAMTRVLAQRPWIMELGFLAAIAWTVASMASNLVELALWRVPDRPPVIHRTAPPPAIPTLEASRLASLTGLPLPGARQEPVAPPFNPSLEPVRTTLPVRLLGTLVAHQPELSLASIEDLSARDWASYAEGEVLGSARVLSIEPSRVMLLVDGRREFLEPTPAPPRVAPAPVSVPRQGRAANAATPPLGTGIRALSADRYDVPRDEVARVLSNLNTVATKARIVPAFRDGKATGFKIFSIRPDSLYSRIGVQNGDVIQRINGLDINSPEKALEAYARMKDATRIDLEIERRGQLVRKTYYVR